MMNITAYLDAECTQPLPKTLELAGPGAVFVVGFQPKKVLKRSGAALTEPAYSYDAGSLTLEVALGNDEALIVAPENSLSFLFSGAIGDSGSVSRSIWLKQAVEPYYEYIFIGSKPPAEAMLFIGQAGVSSVYGSTDGFTDLPNVLGKVLSMYGYSVGVITEQQAYGFTVANSDYNFSSPTWGFILPCTAALKFKKPTDELFEPVCVLSWLDVDTPAEVQIEFTRVIAQQEEQFDAELFIASWF